MKITLCDKWSVLRGRRQDLAERVEVEALTLGAAILQAERIFGVPIKPATLHDKYFIVGDEPAVSTDQPDPPSPDAVPTSFLSRLLARLRPTRPLARCSPGFGNADIHIERDGAMLCPKQDLEFSLISGDIVVFDVLLCWGARISVEI